MTRVTNLLMNQAMSASIQRTQSQMLDTQQQATTGAKSQTYAGLGADTVRSISANGLLSRTEAYASVATRVGTTLSLYDTGLTQLDSTVSTLRQNVLFAIGQGDTSALQSSIEAAFDEFKMALNTSESGVRLFGGSQTNADPVKAGSLADLLTMTNADVLGGDDAVPSARLGDGVDVKYGTTAKAIGSDILDAFRTLAAAGPFGQKPTAAQSAALSAALSQLDNGIDAVRTANAENGRKQVQLDTLTQSAAARAVILKTAVGDAEDADMAQVAINLAQQKTALEASYSVFARLSDLSLVNFLG